MVFGVYSLEPRGDVNCFKLNFKISKWAYYYMKFSRHVNLAILELYFLRHLNFVIFRKFCVLSHFNFAS